VHGKLKVHGVEQERNINATVTTKGDKITVDSTFDIKLEDHSIKRPTILFKKIAEVIKVTVHAELSK